MEEVSLLFEVSREQAQQFMKLEQKLYEDFGIKFDTNMALEPENLESTSGDRLVREWHLDGIGQVGLRARVNNLDELIINRLEALEISEDSLKEIKEKLE